MSITEFNKIRKPKIKRSGVILYTTYENEVFFFMGMDAKSHQLSDFGGGTKIKSKLNPITEALREFHEETLNIFKKFTVDQIKDNICLFDKENLIILINVNLNIKKTFEKYNDTHKKLISSGVEKEPEMCSIVIISLDDLKKCFDKKNIIFSPVKILLKKLNYLEL